MLMSWMALIFGLAALAFIFWVWFNSRRYAKILRAAHYVEVAHDAQPLKDAALDGVATGDELTANDPRIFTTSADLVIAYMIGHRDSSWTHHLTVHMATGFTPHRVAAPTIVFLLRLFGVSLQQAVAEIDSNRIFHVKWTLNNDEQAAFVVREIAVPTLEQARRIHLECLRQRDSLRLGE